MGWNVANMVTNYGYHTKWSKECIEVLVNSQWAGVQNRSCADETVLNCRAQQFQGWFFVWFGDPLFDLTRINTTLLDKYGTRTTLGRKTAQLFASHGLLLSAVWKNVDLEEGLKLKMDGSSSKKGRWSAITIFFFQTTTLINPCWPLLSWPQDTRVSRPNLRKWLPHTWSFGDLACGKWF